MNHKITSLPVLSLSGFVGAVLASSRGVFGVQLSDGVPIFLDEVLCLGDELALSQCHHRDFGVHDCSHYEDAGVICQGKTCLTLS